MTLSEEWLYHNSSFLVPRDFWVKDEMGRTPPFLLTLKVQPFRADNMPELLTSVLHNSGAKNSIGLVNWLLTSQKRFVSWARGHCKIKGNLKQATTEKQLVVVVSFCFSEYDPSSNLAKGLPFYSRSLLMRYTERQVQFMVPDYISSTWCRPNAEYRIKKYLERGRVWERWVDGWDKGKERSKSIVQRMCGWDKLYRECYSAPYPIHTWLVGQGPTLLYNSLCLLWSIKMP